MKKTKKLCGACLFLPAGFEGERTCRCDKEFGHAGRHAEHFSTYARFDLETEEYKKDNTVVISWKEDQRFCCGRHGPSEDPVDCLVCSKLDFECALHGRQKAMFTGGQICQQCTESPDPFVCPIHGPSTSNIYCLVEDCCEGHHLNWKILYEDA